MTDGTDLAAGAAGAAYGSGARFVPIQAVTGVPA